MTVHNFDESLAYSHSQSDQPWWQQVYRQAFPDMVSMVDLRADGWHQRAGRDRAIILSSGRALYIDEKVRTRDYGDMLLEVWSKYPHIGRPPYPDRHDDGTAVEWRNGRRAEPGWAMKPIDCDWLAYAIEPTATCYLIPFFGLRAAMAKSLDRWQRHATAKRHGIAWRVSKNRDYLTVNIVLPLDLLKKAIEAALTVTWSTAAQPIETALHAADPPGDDYDWPEPARPADWEVA